MLNKSKARIGDFKSPLSRRELLTLASAGVISYSMSGWLERAAAITANDPDRSRSCILLWMDGGPSQMDTFDLKPGHTNGGPIKTIGTSVPGLKFGEHLPRLARNAHHTAVIRSMNSREADHGRAAYHLRTGYQQQGAVQYPTMGALIAKEVGDPTLPLPNFVSIAPRRQFAPGAYSSGFLGPQYAPLIVADNINGFNPQLYSNYDTALRVQDLEAPAGITDAQLDARVNILEEMEQEFAASHPSTPTLSHQNAYQRAVTLMRTGAASAFNLDDEPAALRDSYGRNLFGQGCLLARRLVERGVAFVEVTLSGVPGNPGGWDTHGQNFVNVQRLCEVLDPAWATLMEDLETRGLLETTTVVWMGEFGRTPRINNQGGRDHYPQAWSTVLAGGGIRGGQAYGRTSADGTHVISDPPTTVPDFLATVYRALGLDPMHQNMSNVGRPIRLADPSAHPIQEVLA
jgi:uncharacterized protein (DUF1501 family)